jgi:hypothetical protein
MVQSLDEAFSTFDLAEFVPEDEGRRNKLAHLATVCANYPYLLLVAFRLLAYDFDNPVTCRALFAHIKALSPFSRVLGVRVPLYHEMIDLSWRAFGDPAAAANLLQEMDTGGLAFYQDPAHLLGRILREAPRMERRLSSSSDTPAGSLIWKLNSFHAGLSQLAQWRRVVRQRLDEKVCTTYD